MKNLSRLLAVGLVCLFASCSGVRTTDKTFSAHGETIRLVGIPLAGDDQQAALDRVPAGATITTVAATPADWTSIFGILQSLLWLNTTQIGGTIE